ncbi:hypothetical protein AAV94_05735 [Lampropedia cohaerens]|uniref:Cyclic nucleotide-binding protein n=1 Tax=Lampropedia cohaerens TaxID=1610491 RepID=A0A0U1Q0N2_9BURK|nr:DUF294 nucleotidyltransferase-like domain-containing protein [Lampropedia cohaerens]KKW68312.1 hypothetical protein AAV94_05735 [Lampropedia cohaerens]
MASNRTATAAGRQAVMQNLQALQAFLQQYPPFDQMDAVHVLYLLEHSRLVFFAQGQVILAPGDGKVAHWYVVRQGHVIARRGDSGSEPDVPLDLLPGDSFPFAAIIGERASRRTYTAAEDSFCLQLPVADFARLMEASEPFRQYALRGVSTLLGRVAAQLQANATQSLSTGESLDTPLAELVLRQPVTCPPSATIREAVGIMDAQRTSSIAVVDGQMQLQGIFTLRDLRRVVVRDEPQLEAPITQAMTPHPVSLSPQATVFDATLVMAQRQISHLCVVEGGRLLAVVSERDLFALRRLDLVHLARAIRAAPDMPALKQARQDMTRLVAAMLAHGGSAAQVLRIVTQLNDHTVARTIELVLAAHGQPEVDFGWIAFGSEARGEQTLLTDQDNGLIFRADNEAHAQTLQAQLLPLAQAINQALDEVGLNWCAGNIMAGNPALCRADFQWQRFFAQMLRESSAQDVLHSTIFFDARLVWGEDCGFAQMQRLAVDAVQQETVFQRLMATHALARRPPPVGGLRKKLLNVMGVGQERLDLKKDAITLFVDAVRVLALAHGITAASTVRRLQLLGQQGALTPARVQACETAFNYLQQLRLHQHQQQALRAAPLDNGIDVATLNTLEQRVLRGALVEAARLQDVLRLRYQL